MSRIVLRLLLIVCLVLTSTGNAMAAVAMPAMAGGTHDVSASNVVNAPAVACHEAGEPVAVAAEVQHPAQPTAPHPADCDQGCCANGACQCPCVSVAQAALVGLPLPTAEHGRARMSAAFLPGHVAPALRDSIRPPIS